MPSFFLSKVFGRKKQDDNESSRSQGHGRVSDASLLEGKFEAVSPTVSPTASNFIEAYANGKANGKDKEKDFGFSLFKTKSGSSFPDDSLQKRYNLPHLSLNLPGPKVESNSRALGVVFEADPDAQILLSDSVIGERRLNPLETLILVRACSQAITARGLETLGIMHPHWHSASPDIQRKLISLFIQSLAPKSPITTLSPTPSTPVSAFESEIKFTRSPHDVAAVLRWGLRHLQLEGNSFGKDEEWYKNFSDSERLSQYPAKAFSEKLVPQLPPAHLELLSATLDVLSSLAAHAEANSTSGSKLSKFFGLWLLTAQRAEEKDDWSTFYARWEQAGRVLEHLFLSRIRDEALDHRMPTRLSELVRNYPFHKATTPSTDVELFPRPRFSTRRYDALFVRIDTELSGSGTKPKHHPLRLLADALKAEVVSEGSQYVDVWEKIKKAGTDESQPSPGGYPGLSRVFADETVRFLSLIPANNTDKEPTFNLFLPQRPNGASRRRSFSMSDSDQAATAAAAAASVSNAQNKASPPLPTSPSPTTLIATDWSQFSTAGFLETGPVSTHLAATLFDKDVEVTAPRRPSKRSKVPRISPSRGRKSLDNLPPTAVAERQDEDVKMVSKSTAVSLIQLDEAFIDFWSDALLDPISSNWPAFIICKLKASAPGLDAAETGISWLVVEQTFNKPALSPTTLAPESPRRPRPSSPKPSFVSDISTTFSATRKRFSFFGGSRSSSSVNVEKATKGRKKFGKSPQIGEMGEILAEEDEKPESHKLEVPSVKPQKSVEFSKKSVESPTKVPDDGRSNALGIYGLDAVLVPTGAAPSSAAIAVEETKPEVKNEPEIKPPVQPAAEPTPVVDTAPIPVTVAPTQVPAAEAETTPTDEVSPVPEASLALKTTLTPEIPAKKSPTTSKPKSRIPVAKFTRVPPPSSPIASAPEPVHEAEILTEKHQNSAPESPSKVAETQATNEQPTPLEKVEHLNTNGHVEPLRKSPEGLDSVAGVVSLPPVPIVEAEPVLVSQPSVVPLVPAEDTSPEVAALESPNIPEVEVPELPPAPESVVLSGETAGPQVALSTSEPVAIARIVSGLQEHEEVSPQDQPAVVSPVEGPETTPEALKGEGSEKEDSTPDISRKSPVTPTQDGSSVARSVEPASSSPLSPTPPEPLDSHIPAIDQIGESDNVDETKAPEEVGSNHGSPEAVVEKEYPLVSNGDVESGHSVPEIEATHHEDEDTSPVETSVNTVAEPLETSEETIEQTEAASPIEHDGSTSNTAPILEDSLPPADADEAAREPEPIGTSDPALDVTEPEKPEANTEEQLTPTVT